MEDWMGRESRKLLVSKKIYLLVLIILACAVFVSAQNSDLESPRQLWERLQEGMPPFTYEIEQDEVAPSATNPSLNLRCITVRFISQEINGAKMGHTAQILMPADKNSTKNQTASPGIGS